MLVREACCLKVEQKRAIIGVAMCSMECYGLFSILTHELKTLLLRPSTRSVERKSGTCASSSWSKISGSPAKLLQIETSDKHSMSSESSGEGAVTDTDFESARTLGNRHVCPAYSMTITVRLSGVVMLPP